MYLHKILNLSIYCVNTVSISFIEFRGCITQKTNHSVHPFLVNNDFKTHQQIIVRCIRQKKILLSFFKSVLIAANRFNTFDCHRNLSLSAKSHNSSMNEYIFSTGGN